MSINNINKYTWHSLTAEEALVAMATQKGGLSQEEAAKRLKLYGQNIIASAPPPSILRRFARQFNNILIYILLGSAVMTGLLQHWTDTGVIIAVVLINSFIGFIQESKAEQALASIKQLLSPRANVIRGGKAQILDAVNLVPGDIVILNAGDKVPADIRLIEAYDIQAQEAILTGESTSVEKSEKPVDSVLPLNEQSSLVFSGTLITAGQGKGVVVATGKETEIGRISSMLAAVESPETPMTRKMKTLSFWIAVIVMFISAGMFLFGIFLRSIPMEEMFMVMVGMAVSAIPEGLPAVISITLALGIRAMARRNAIVRHMPVIESLGNVTVICSDKTGTLTYNELSVHHIITADHSFTVTGVGYNPEGKFLFEEKEVEIKDYAAAHEMMCGAALNNDSSLSLKKGVWELNGDPTEGALMSLALKAGHNHASLNENFPRKDVIPFSAESRYMATLHQHNDCCIIYVKGAPEKLLSTCHMQLNSEGEEENLAEEYWQQKIAELAGKGERVLAIAKKRTAASKQELKNKDVESEMVLLGLFGISDLPREEAKPAIAECYQAGIAVKMITGDHILTASAIGKTLGIKDSNLVMTGREMDKLSDKALASTVNSINIYARMHPEQKLRLIKALQANGEIVAMTGDGVNDAPALKMADIGIAMGKNGTEVAKEAAKIVLADDNFASIVNAVEKGRNIYDNLRKTLQFMLVTDASEALTLVFALLVGLTLPITPLQILWVNMITSVTLSMAFAFAPDNIKIMQKKPLPPNAPIFSWNQLLHSLIEMLVITLCTLGIFYYMDQSGESAVTSRTIAVNVLVFCQIYYLLWLFPKANFTTPKLLPLIIPVVLIIIAQGLFTSLPVLQEIFSTTHLSFTHWLIVIIVSSSIFIWSQAQYLISRRFLIKINYT